jgi:hypothetical protein
MLYQLVCIYFVVWWILVMRGVVDLPGVVGTGCVFVCVCMTAATVSEGGSGEDIVSFVLE